MSDVETWIDTLEGYLGYAQDSRREDQRLKAKAALTALAQRLAAVTEERDTYRGESDHWHEQLMQERKRQYDGREASLEQIAIYQQVLAERDALAQRLAACEDMNSFYEAEWEHVKDERDAARAAVRELEVCIRRAVESGTSTKDLYIAFRHSDAFEVAAPGGQDGA